MQKLLIKGVKFQKTPMCKNSKYEYAKTEKRYTILIKMSDFIGIFTNNALFCIGKQLGKALYAVTVFKASYSRQLLLDSTSLRTPFLLANDSHIQGSFGTYTL
jgi:hypothetical protein